MDKTLFVLGAADPEMQYIEALLVYLGRQIAYAVGSSGERVFPGNAYKAIGYRFPGSVDLYETWDGPVVFVECEIPDYRGYANWVDHHRDGDPGYGRPPAEFFGASSLGQILSLLGPSGVGEPQTRIRVRADRKHILADVTVRITTPKGEWLGGCADPDHCPQHSGVDVDGTPMVGLTITVSGQKAHRLIQERLMIAAADHCLAHAYRGRCPGVNPDDLMEWRAKSRAEFQKRTKEEVLADVEGARMTLNQAKVLILSCGDLNHCGFGNCGCGPQCYGSGEENASTRYGTGDCYCNCDGCQPFIMAKDMRGVKVPELPEASARDGVCFVSDGLRDKDGRVKVVCQSGTPEQIRAFMEKWAPSQGLVDIYGDPARGFAGGYKKENS